jgi:Ca2+-binding EF-hand superfamily protein
MRPLILAAAATALLAAAGSAAAQPPAADIIKQWDTNKDGVVDKAEWTAAGRPAERFELVDANKDGKVTADELAAALAAMRKQQGGQ